MPRVIAGEPGERSAPKGKCAQGARLVDADEQLGGAIVRGGGAGKVAVRGERRGGAVRGEVETQRLG
jgi:hypothetical protein